MSLRRLTCTLLAIAIVVLAGCGGGGSMPGMMGAPQSDDGPMPSASLFGDTNVEAVVADNILTAMEKAARVTPRAGSVTQSSNVDSRGVTTDQVEATAEYGVSQHRFSLTNGTKWSIGMGEGNPRQIPDVNPPFKGSKLSKRVGGGTIDVNAYSDIEAPTTRQIQTTSYIETTREIDREHDGTVNVPPGTQILGEDITLHEHNDGQHHQHDHDSHGHRGTLDGEPGTFHCIGECNVFRGMALSGFWTFTPDNPPDPAVQVTETVTVPVTETTTVREPDTDYLVLGFWLVVPDNASSAADYVFGAFADGSDPFEQAHVVALQGTATYEGAATGVYSEKTAESTSIGYFDGDVELTADFGGGSDFGTINGSITNFKADGEPVDGTLNLETANIGARNSGFFEGEASGSDGERLYVGTWGGQFFGNDESDGRPGSVAGTFGGHSTDDAVNFVGAFGAYKE